MFNYNFNYLTRIIESKKILFYLIVYIYLIECSFLNVNTSNTTNSTNLINQTLVRERLISNATRICSNIAVNSNYVEYTILYKDNVDSVTECCEFCNSNSACTVWTLQLDIGRCLLKSNRGTRIIDPGFISGFSDQYYLTLSTPIPTTPIPESTLPSLITETTSESTTITTTTQTSSLTSDYQIPITKCEIFNHVTFGQAYVNQATNVTLSICCDFCADFNICKSYTYYAVNRTCLLYDGIDLESRPCLAEEQCQSGRIFVNNSTTVLPTLNPTTSTNLIQAYSFYSMFDRFQLKISNLSQDSDYSFLNNIPLNDDKQILFLHNSIRSLESSIVAQINFYLQNNIYRVVIDNMAYLPSTRSIVVSFIVVINPSIQDINEGNGYLSIFNSLIANQIGFKQIKFFNETWSNSDLLPSVSFFSLKLLNINDLDQISFERMAISTTKSDYKQYSGYSTVFGNETTLGSSLYSTSQYSQTNKSTLTSQITTITTGTTTTTKITAKTTTTSSTTTTMSSTTTTSSSTSSTTTTSSTKTTSTTTTTTSTTTSTTTTTTTTTTSTTTSTKTTTKTTTTTTTTTKTAESQSIFSTEQNSFENKQTREYSTEKSITNDFSQTNEYSSDSTQVLSTTNQNQFDTLSTTTKFYYDTSNLNDQSTEIISQSYSEYSSQNYYTSQFSSLIDLSTKLSSIDKCWLEEDTLYLGPDLVDLKNVFKLEDCCQSCYTNTQCQSWVYNYLNKTCTLKSSFRHGYYAISGYTSGFSKQAYDSYIKIANSLGIKNINLSQILSNISDTNGLTIKDNIVDLIQKRLFNLWFRYLYSNIRSVELLDISINVTYSNELDTESILDKDNILIITYLLKLDPRISQNSQIIIKLINTINNTLMLNSGLYNGLGDNLTTDIDEPPIALVIPNSQISLVQIELDLTTVNSHTTINYQTTVSQTTDYYLTSPNSLVDIKADLLIDTFKDDRCYIELNLNYISNIDGDILAQFYASTREKCCFDCNRIAECQSWTYDILNGTCSLKKTYRSNPIVTQLYVSGFKPNNLFSLAISRGLEFKNVNNPIFNLLSNSTPSSTERDLYNFLTLDLAKQITNIVKSNQIVNFVLKTLITDVTFNDASIIIDYELSIDPRFNDKMTDIQKLMNNLYAIPNNSKNELLDIILPFGNINESEIIVQVPTTTSQFQIVSANSSHFPIRTTTPILTTTISLDQYSKYIGCFNDVPSNRDLSYSGVFATVDNHTSMTIPYCIEICRNLSQSYAGLQFGRECYCGNTYGKHGEADKKDCFVTCAGDKKSICGGFLKNSIYSVGLYYTTESTTETTTTTTTFSFEQDLSSDSTRFYSDIDFTITNSIKTATTTTTTTDTTIKSTSEQYYTSNEFVTSIKYTDNTNENVTNDSTDINDKISSTLQSWSNYYETYTHLSSTTTINNLEYLTSYELPFITDPTISLDKSTDSLINYFSTTSLYLITSTTPILSTNTELILPLTTQYQTDITFISISSDTSTSTTFTSQSLLTRLTSTEFTISNNKIIISEMTETDKLSTLEETPVSSNKISISTSITTTQNNQFTDRASNLDITDTSSSHVQTVTTTTTTSPITGQTLQVSTSSGIISPSPILNDPGIFIITRIRVNKTINVQSEPFKIEITNGLKRAYQEAFARASSIFSSQLSRAVQEGTANIQTKIDIVLVNVTLTGETNAENSKNIIDLRYYVLNDNKLVSSDYAADSINLLSGQEMAQYLNHEVENQGYVEVKPRQVVAVDQKLWIIGAVLGPLFIVFILFWIILFVYYKFINPRKAARKNSSKSESKILTNESPLSSQENLKKPRRVSSKIKPVESQTQTDNDDDDVLVKSTQLKTTENFLSNKEAEIIQMPDMKNISKVEVNRTDSIINTDSSNTNDEIENSIRQKSDLEKWRNKQRQREKEKNYERIDESSQTTEVENLKETSSTLNSRRKASKKIAPIVESNKNQDQLFEKRSSSKKKHNETKSHVSIHTNNSDILNNQSNQVNNNFIVSEYSKQHLPVKLNVAHRPTVEDTTRVYNPYPLQNEYDKYARNGVHLEPINHSKIQAKSSYSLDEINKNSLQRNVISSVSQVGPMNNANVSFTSEVISPYARKENSIYLKKPVDNDRLLDYARGSPSNAFVNNAFRNDIIETEFQNLNHLKKKSDANESNLTSENVNEKKENNADGDGKLYEDEYEIINRIRKQTGSNPNLELINSINKELKRLKTGYKPDSSNA